MKKNRSKIQTFQDLPGKFNVEGLPPEKEAAVSIPTDLDSPNQSAVERVKCEYEDELMAFQGAVGVGVTKGHASKPVIVVYLSHAGNEAQIPKELDGIQVITEVTGEFDAFPTSENTSR